MRMDLHGTTDLPTPQQVFNPTQVDRPHCADCGSINIAVHTVRRPTRYFRCRECGSLGKFIVQYTQFLKTS